MRLRWPRWRWLCRVLGHSDGPVDDLHIELNLGGVTHIVPLSSDQFTCCSRCGRLDPPLDGEIEIVNGQVAQVVEDTGL